MAYDRGKIFVKAKENIVKHRLFFIDDVISYAGISKQTFYDFFKVDSDELDDIKELLNKNRVEVKVAIRQKLFKGDKAAELLALYKLICTDEERKALSMNYTEVDNKGHIVAYNSVVSKEEAKAISDALENDC